MKDYNQEFYDLIHRHWDRNIEAMTRNVGADPHSEFDGAAASCQVSHHYANEHSASRFYGYEVQS